LPPGDAPSRRDRGRGRAQQSAGHLSQLRGVAGGRARLCRALRTATDGHAPDAHRTMYLVLPHVLRSVRRRTPHAGRGLAAFCPDARCDRRPPARFTPTCPNGCCVPICYYCRFCPACVGVAVGVLCYSTTSLCSGAHIALLVS